MLSQYPKLIADNNKLNNKFGIEYDKWFSDRFFGRNELIKLYGLQKHDIKENLKVLSEEDNWLFFKGDNSLRTFANLDILNDEQLQQVAFYISDIDNWCKKYKKQFILVIAPDKNKIYGEHIKQITKAFPDSKSRAVRLVEYLKNNTNANVLYLYDDLIAHKSNELLYFKNDTHWNSYGAYIGYVAIMKALHIKPITYKNTFTKTNPHGDLTNMATNIPEDNETLYKFPDIQNTYTCDILNETKDTICKNKNYKINKEDFDYCYYSWQSPYHIVTITDKPQDWNCCVWDCVYKRDMIGEERFNPELKIAEDYDFNKRVLKGKKANITKVLYFYNDTPNSLLKRNS